MRPRLIVIAGPNGAGKTTFTERVLAHQWLAGCQYVNPDLIANERFGGWNEPSAILQAAQEADRLRESCLAEGQSLAFETVFSSPPRLDFLRRAQAAGYFTRLFYIGTDSPRINAARVAQRVLEGGHDVPIPKIISRRRKSIAQLAQALGVVDRGYVYDNSVDGELPALLFRTVDGRLAKTYREDHEWAMDVRSSDWKAAPKGARSGSKPPAP